MGREEARAMSDPWGDDPAGEDEELWREQVVNDAVAGHHVPTDEELDLEALEREGFGAFEEDDSDDESDDDETRGGDDGGLGDDDLDQA
jgi:hypothetical protein